jgi:hypothetical protein
MIWKIKRYRTRPMNQLRIEDHTLLDASMSRVSCADTELVLSKVPIDELD